MKLILYVKAIQVLIFFLLIISFANEDWIVRKINLNFVVSKLLKYFLIVSMSIRGNEKRSSYY